MFKAYSLATLEGSGNFRRFGIFGERLKQGSMNLKLI
jgi:hypothetical protein